MNCDKGLIFQTVDKLLTATVKPGTERLRRGPRDRGRAGPAPARHPSTGRLPRHVPAACANARGGGAAACASRPISPSPTPTVNSTPEPTPAAPSTSENPPEYAESVRSFDSTKSVKSAQSARSSGFRPDSLKRSSLKSRTSSFTGGSDEERPHRPQQTDWGIGDDARMGLE